MKKRARRMNRVKEEASKLNVPLPWSRDAARSLRKKRCAERALGRLKASA